MKDLIELRFSWFKSTEWQADGKLTWPPTMWKYTETLTLNLCAHVHLQCVSYPGATKRAAVGKMQSSSWNNLPPSCRLHLKSSAPSNPERNSETRLAKPHGLVNTSGQGDQGQSSWMRIKTARMIQACRLSTLLETLEDDASRPQAAKQRNSTTSFKPIPQLVNTAPNWSSPKHQVVRWVTFLTKAHERIDRDGQGAS